jgi:predicted amidophosphoribosyltransferase
MVERVRRRYGCPGCGRRVRTAGRGVWCETCCRHMVPIGPDFPRPADPERERRIVAHVERVQREMPREGTLDPYDALSRPAL